MPQSMPHSKRVKTKGLTAFSTLVFTSLFAVNAQSAVLYVNGASSSESVECASADSPCKKISDAITKALAGDEIHIAKGTYTIGATLTVDKAIHFKGGYSSDFKSKSNTPSGTIITANNDTNVKHLFNITSSVAVSFDALTLSGLNGLDANSSAIFSSGGELIITNSQFTGNNAVSGAALHLVGVDAKLDRVLFNGNTSSAHGGAVFLDGGSNAVIQNATFYQNKADGGQDTSWGGAIAAKGSDLTLIYSTLYKNVTDAGYGGGVAVWGDANKEASFFGNLFLANTANDQASNLAVKQGETQVVDNGSNIFGFNDEPGLSDVSGSLMNQTKLFGAGEENYELKSETLSEADINKIIVDVNGPKDNGGSLPSIKIVKNGPAMNQIDSGNAPFFGIGKSCEYAFTSLQQAHSAVKVLDGYTADSYFFELGKADANAVGNCEVVFNAQVNNEGWVKVTSENEGAVTSDMYDEATEKADDLSFWVRSSNSYCDGTKTSTDTRGLPRVDFLNPDDINQAGKVQKCDIGAFEFNDGYQYDCHDEDGMRADNRIDILGSGEANVEICFGGDWSKATPKAIFNNIQLGSANFGLIFVGLLLFGFRLFRVKRNACQV